MTQVTLQYLAGGINREMVPSAFPPRLRLLNPGKGLRVPDSDQPPVTKRRNHREGKPPAFQLYASDILVDERCAVMTPAQFGSYCRLLFYHWREGSVPADPEKLARLTGVHPGAQWRAVWKGIAECFQPHPELPGRLIQFRMYEEQILRSVNAKRQSESASRAGRKSAQVRAAMQRPVEFPLNDRSTMHLHLPLQQDRGSLEGLPQNEILPLTDTLPAKVSAGARRGRRVKQMPGEPDGFTRFYARYPRKVDRAEALVEWNRLKPDQELEDRIIASIAVWEQTELWREGKIIYPSRFLKRRRWEAVPPTDDATVDWKTGFLAKFNANKEKGP
jgi:uncharacterized protein YdaU (DUF1376 family)